MRTLNTFVLNFTIAIIDYPVSEEEIINVFGCLRRLLGHPILRF